MVTMKALPTLARVALVAAVTAACSPIAQSPAQPIAYSPTATVLRAVDGDTVDVRDDTRGRLRVRVLGLDAPELHKPGWSVGCYAAEAADFASQNLTGRRVAVAPDPGQDLHDKYGRTLAYIIRDDGWNYSVEAVRSGMAHPYVYDHNPASLSPDINAAEAEAKAAGAGLWGPKCNGHTESVKQR
ncbi:thermonuclease family protein [Mycolicibacterium lutetiense]